MNILSILLAFCFFSTTACFVNDVLLQLVEKAIHDALENSSVAPKEASKPPQHSQAFSHNQPSEASKLLQFKGEMLGAATLFLRKQGVVDFEKANKLLDNLGVDNSVKVLEDSGERCAGPPKNCQDPVHDSIRSITGYCNDRKNPTDGNSLTPIRRLLGATSYADGVQEVRSKSVTGSSLPSARLVSNRLHDTGSSVYESPSTNHLHMQIGQFVAHDLIFMPSSVAKDGSGLDCSSCASATTVSPNCAPIPVPSDDKYFFPASKAESRCLRLTRALNGQTGLGARTQINQNTHFLDMSTVYGSSDCEARTVRSFSNGLLKTYTGMGYVLPPQNPSDSNCQSKSPYYCFTAGDFRNSLHPGLLPLHSVFIKEHNRLAVQIKALKSSFNDEQIYQLARKIMIGQWQHIVYEEYLPKLLSAKYMTNFNLKSGAGSYNSILSPALTAEFAAAAFRFGHSQSRQNFVKKNASMVTFDKYDLGQNVFYADQMYQKSKGGWESVLLGFIGSSAMKVDRYFSFPIRNQLFETRGKPGSGVDLVAVNIMRGRDVGLLPYVQYRSAAGLSRVSSWKDISSTFSETNIEALKTVYKDPEDIDLFTGVVMEQPLPEGQLGPTASFIIAEQFRATKTGDRFFYENKVAGTVGFNSQQLDAIRKVKLAKILCNNMDSISSINTDIFDKSSKQIRCSSLPDLDVKLFV